MFCGHQKGRYNGGSYGTRPRPLLLHAAHTSAHTSADPVPNAGAANTIPHTGADTQPDELSDCPSHQRTYVRTHSSALWHNEEH